MCFGATEVGIYCTILNLYLGEVTSVWKALEDDGSSIV